MNTLITNIVVRARRLFGPVWLLPLFGAATTQAAEWIVQPSIDLASVYDDNAELTTRPHTASSGYILAPRINVKRNTETAKMDLDAYTAFTDYQRGEVPDRTESVASLRSTNQTSERGTFGVDGELRRDTLLERLNPGRGVGDLRDVDVGLSTLADVRRTYVAANPYFDWLLSERSAVRVGYRLTDVGFSNAGGTSLVGYKEHIASGSYTHQLSEQNSASLAANVIRYRPDNNLTEADTTQLLAGLNRKFSETLRGSLAVGGSRTTQSQAGVEDSSSGLVLRADLEQKTEISQLDTVLSRDVAPSGIGRAVRTDQYRVRWLRKTSPTVDFSLEGQVIRNRVLEGTDPSVDRRYIEVGPQFTWHWIEHWSISGGYRYRRQKYDADANSADSNAVYLGVRYAL